MNRQEHAERLWNSIKGDIPIESRESARKYIVRYTHYKNKEAWDESQPLANLAEEIGQTPEELAKNPYIEKTDNVEAIL